MKKIHSHSWILISLAAALMATACADSKNPQTATEASEMDSGIVGGEEALLSDRMARSTVALEAPGYGVFCTAVLISKNLILTAAHCATTVPRPGSMSVVFGTNLAGLLEKRKVLGGKASEEWTHLNSAQEKNWGDIAVLRFEGQIPKGYLPVPILTTAEDLKDGMNVFIYGYGLTQMRTIQQPQIDPNKLMKATVKIADVQSSETELTLEQTDGKGACHGDSGGPAFAKIKRKLYVIGITSRSATKMGGLNCMEGSIYTSVAKEKNFIETASAYLNSPEFVENEPIPQPELDH